MDKRAMEAMRPAVGQAMGEMSAQDEAHSAGQRQAYINMLRECLRGLGGDYDDQYAWVVERAEAVSKLREVCAEHGDNKWPDSLHLADVIDGHLFRWLEVRYPKDAIIASMKERIERLEEALDAMHIMFGENFPDGESYAVDAARAALRDGNQSGVEIPNPDVV